MVHGKAAGKFDCPDQPVASSQPVHVNKQPRSQHTRPTRVQERGPGGDDPATVSQERWGVAADIKLHLMPSTPRRCFHASTNSTVRYLRLTGQAAATRNTAARWLGIGWAGGLDVLRVGFRAISAG